MAAVSIILVLTLGNLLGAVIKGITGFGSAIINLCVWIVATCCGINSGTLQQAVLTECICSEVLAIPLLFMTRAHATCDWALVLSLSIFGAVGAPIGAAMLTHLPPRKVEFAVGCLMLLVILLNLRQKKSTGQDTNQQQGCIPLAATGPSLPTAATGIASPEDAPSEQHKAVQLQCWSAEPPASKDQQTASADQAASIRSPASSMLAQDAGALSLVQDSPVPRHSSSSSSFSSDAACVCIISPEHDWPEHAEHTALLAVDGAKPPCSDNQEFIVALNSSMKPLAAPVDTAASNQQHSSCDIRQRMSCWWAATTQPDRLAALRKMFAMGSLAGTASGIMAGLTGMGGPPVMLMFEKLQVSKDAVRGTNAVCNVIQVRIFAYIAMGVFTKADIDLYIAVSVAAVVGMFVGCLLAARTNQAQFSRMLTALMILCCVLMFASAAGITGNSPDQHSSTTAAKQT